ncbi:unnamed protein product [Rhizopus stolonifer]
MEKATVLMFYQLTLPSICIHLSEQQSCTFFFLQTYECSTIEEYYKTPKEISEALKVKDLTSLTKGLSRLRAQLTFALKDCIDPTEKQTRPLVEYAQFCTNCHEINNLWDYQASTNIQDLECMLPDIVGLFIRLCKTPVIRSFGSQIIETVLSRQMKYIYRGISSMRIPQCQSTFRLMTAMVHSVSP